MIKTNSCRSKIKYYYGVKMGDTCRILTTLEDFQKAIKFFLYYFNIRENPEKLPTCTTDLSKLKPAFNSYQYVLPHQN